MNVTEKPLMRDCVVIEYTAAITGVKNAVFTLTIPEGYVMLVHDVDFGIMMGSGSVANTIKFLLVDDPDETADPGYSAEKVIQCDTFLNEFLTSGRSFGYLWRTKDCHKTALVVNPNFITDVVIAPGATITLYCRIWFEFLKETDKNILMLLRQQQY